nr:Amidohydrolase family [uncultured bacterium]
MSKNKCRIFFVALAVLCFSLPGVAQLQSAKPYRFINGQWFNGQSFRRQTFYCVKGILTKKKLSGEFATIDLSNGFVVPPFSEAHNHNLAGGIYFNREFNEKTIRRYLAAGVFYVKIPGNPGANAPVLRSELVNRPDSVDAVFANGVLTSRDGHPMGMTLDSFKQAKIDVPSVAELEGKVLFIIENETDLLTKWKQIMTGKPDFIKVILRYSENFAGRRGTPELFGYNGLDPQLLPVIVKQAHAAGLRVSAHIDSAADFAAAVNAGVDEINHLPGAVFEKGTDEAGYLITPETAKRAAKQNIFVVTTTSIAKFYAKGEALEKVQSVQRKNLRLLNKNGVRLAVGSDNFMDTSLEEAMYLKSLDVFDNAELLKMWSVTGAQAIFPNRRIGHLREGYEASFIVLRGNPLEDFERVKDIQLRFKQGILIKND